MPWQLDTAHSSITFAVKHMVIATVKGEFQQFDVQANVDEANLAASTATVTIEAASVATREQQRDDHLRSADFLDIANFPTVTFTTKRITAKGDEHKIVGDLTIHGVTKEVDLEGEITGPLKDPWGGTRVGLSAEGKISRKDFGLTYNAVLEAGGMLVGDQVKLSVDLELVKAA